ncbi:unnamed protein product [Mytilus coruscus]|uniref:Cyclic nucleotide-binding domain-containing protein n=1 Tax=Mytilus coruscus TaxID=42192 RepID=A0A6J8AJD6_MYTCO|nr:unnamed protein product [Mytilus coruscus]
MEIFKEGNEETFDKRSRIKQNVRVVSPSTKHKRILSRQHKSSHYLDNRISSAMSSDSNKIPPKIDHLRKEIAQRESTMPNFLDCYDLKTVYDEANLRKKFREVVEIRNHTSPAMQQRIDPEKDEKQFVEYMKKKQHASLSGLWNMAAWSVFEHRTSRVHNIDELTMALLSKQMAIKKMREKISRKLELPVDKFKRIAQLRQNVSFIEQKFENLKQTRPKKTQLLKTMHLFEQAGTSNMPSRFTKPGEAKAFFRKFGRIVLHVIVLNWIFLIMDSSESSRLERELKSFVDIAQEAVNAKTSQAMVEQGLSFDKQAYKANKEQVMHGLQALKSLADYPLRTQERLCQVAWYQTLGPKKVILREGHNAESFYFILAGTAPRVDTGIAHKRKFVMTPEVFEEMSKYYEKLKQGLNTLSGSDDVEDLMNETPPLCLMKQKLATSCASSVTSADELADNPDEPNQASANITYSNTMLRLKARNHISEAKNTLLVGIEDRRNKTMMARNQQILDQLRPVSVDKERNVSVDLIRTVEILQNHKKDQCICHCEYSELHNMNSSIDHADIKPHTLGQAVFQMDYQINLTSEIPDDKSGLVSDIVMMDDGKLVICLPNQDRLLICYIDGSQIESINVQGEPWYVTTVNNSTVAVTQREGKRIEMYDVNNKLKVNSISVPAILSSCDITTAIHNKLVIYKNYKLLIIDPQTGEVVRKTETICDPFSLHGSDDRIFYCEDNDDKNIYWYSYTDDKHHNLTLPSQPWSMTTLQDGSVYILCIDGSVQHVSSDCKQYKTVESNKPKDLQSLAYNPNKKKLITRSDRCGIFNVFNEI